jgi:hypothetical protein
MHQFSSPYSYGTDPVNFVDPNGLSTCTGPSPDELVCDEMTIKGKPKSRGLPEPTFPSFPEYRPNSPPQRTIDRGVLERMKQAYNAYMDAMIANQKRLIANNWTHTSNSSGCQESDPSDPGKIFETPVDARHHQTPSPDSPLYPLWNALSGGLSELSGGVFSLQGDNSSSQAYKYGGLVGGLTILPVPMRVRPIVAQPMLAQNTTLLLPNTMQPELAAYQAAAARGELIKTYTRDLPRPNVRKLWEATTGAPVPPGYDVDHILQRQFGGGDEFHNLQLKRSGLNQWEGTTAYQLNKSCPVGTKFTDVRLAP